MQACSIYMDRIVTRYMGWAYRLGDIFNNDYCVTQNGQFVNLYFKSCYL